MAAFRWNSGITSHLATRITTDHWLVVWNMNVLFFHILGIIIPTDELIFFRGVGIPPTRYCYPIVIPLLSILNHIKPCKSHINLVYHQPNHNRWCGMRSGGWFGQALRGHCEPRRIDPWSRCCLVRWSCAVWKMCRFSEKTAIDPMKLWKRGLKSSKIPGLVIERSYWKWPFIVDLPIENGDFP